MGLISSDTFLKGGLGFLIANCDRIVLCSTQPDGVSEVATTDSSGVALSFSSDATNVAGFGASPLMTSDDFAIAASTRAAGGLSVTTTQFTAMSVAVATSMSHVALVAGASSGVLAITKLQTVRSVTTADTVTCPAFRIEIADPTTSDT